MGKIEMEELIEKVNKKNVFVLSHSQIINYWIHDIYSKLFHDIYILIHINYSKIQGPRLCAVGQ
jgi:hypothetical protein